MRELSTAEQFANLRSSYDASKASNNRFMRTRLQGMASGRGGDYHIKNQTQFFNMVELAREFERNESLFRQGVRRATNNINVGGMRLDPETGDDDLDDYLTEKWNTWAEDKDQCDQRRKHNFATMANMALGRVFVDGDIFGVGRSTGRLQNLEAHRCKTPNRAKKNRGVCGVISNEDGEPTAYTFTKTDREHYETIKVDEVETVSARNNKGHRQVFHVHRPERFSLSRGITSVAPIVGPIGMRDDLDFSTLVKAQTNSCITFFEKWEIGSEPDRFDNSPGGLGDDVDTVAAKTNARKSAKARRQVKMNPGKVLESKGPGHSWEGFTPNVPNAEYFQLSALLLTYMAINIDLPVIVFLMDAKDANFSSYRNAMDQARMGFTEIRRWFADQYHRDVYRWKVRDWLRTDERLMKFRAKEIAAGVTNLEDSALFKHTWNEPGYEYIEPVKDATRWTIERGNGQTTEKAFQAKRGTEWKRHWKQVITERAWIITSAIKEAQKIKEATGIDVDWKMLAPIPLPSHIKLSIVDGPSNAEEDGSAKPDDSNKPTNNGGAT